MFAFYGRHLTGLTTLLPGAIEMLEDLRAQGIGLGLVTNKPQRFIETILDHFGLSQLFAIAVGGDAGMPAKPAPDMLLAAMKALGATQGATVMVGGDGPLRTCSPRAMPAWRRSCSGVATRPRLSSSSAPTP